MRLAYHIERWWPLYLWLLVAQLAFSKYYLLSINVSESLPGKIYLVEKNVTPKKGELVAFRWHGVWPYDFGTLFLKRIAGTAGDFVRAESDGHFDVAGTLIGPAKSHARTGRPLTPATEGEIPEGRIFVHTEHPDSYDSRYQEVGLIRTSAVVGRAYRIF